MIRKSVCMCIEEKVALSWFEKEEAVAMSEICMFCRYLCCGGLKEEKEIKNNNNTNNNNTTMKKN